MLPLLLIRIIITVVSITGFIMQVYHISYQYFTYSTRAQITIQLPKTIGKHKVSLCFQLFDILDYKRLKEETNMSRSEFLNVDNASSNASISRDGNLLTIEAMERTLTVRQMFNMTPDANEVVENCMFRDDESDLNYYNRDECTKRQLVTKQVYLDMMCYQFQPRTVKGFDHNLVAQSMGAQFVISESRLSKLFRTVNKIQTISFLGGPPSKSRYFASITLMKNSKGEKQSDHLDVVPSDVMIRRLPPPYDTACIDSSETWYECQEKCLLREYEPFGRIPADLIIDKEYDARIVFRRQKNNVRKDPRYQKADDLCGSECLKNHCNQDYTKTHAYTRLYQSPNPVGFTLFAPLEPETVLISVPNQAFIDFFSFICGCFGTWFGISFFSLVSFTRREETSAPVVYKDSVIVNCTCTCNKVTRRQRLIRM